MLLPNYWRYETYLIQLKNVVHKWEMHITFAYYLKLFLVYKDLSKIIGIVNIYIYIAYIYLIMIYCNNI